MCFHGLNIDNGVVMNARNEKKLGVFYNVFRVLSFLSDKSRQRLRFLVGFMFVGALAEIINIGALLPFLAILAAPETAFTDSRLAPIINALNINSDQQLIYAVSAAFVLVVLVSCVVRVALLRYSTATIFSAGHEIAVRAYKNTLSQPYTVHINRNTSEIVSALSVKTGSIMFDILFPWSVLLNAIIVIAFVVLTLFFISPAVSVAIGVIFALIYLVVVGISHRHLRRNGLVVAQEQTRSVKILQEGLGGIRDVLIDKTQQFYVDDFTRSDGRLRTAQGNNLFIGGSPRYIVEALGVAVIACLALLLSQSGGLIAALPVLGALALGAQRLLPAFNQAQNSWSLIAGNQGVLKDVLVLLEQPAGTKASRTDAPLKFFQDITFRGVQFTYPGAANPAITVENVTINRGAKIGIIGTTGGGKSTFLDVLMGLLPPDQGDITVDDVPLTATNAGAWQEKLAHVPQHIYLTDGTVRSNIALGVSPNRIDEARLQTAVDAAQVRSFLQTLPQGLDSHIGEQGVRLSGGQRQRIGIARALYKRAEVLILDEATSALDQETERAVMESIEAFSKGVTIVIVAHRTSTLETCEVVYSINNGVVRSTHEES